MDRVRMKGAEGRFWHGKERFCARFRPLALEVFAPDAQRGAFERPKIRPSPFKLESTLMHYKRCAESNAAVFWTWEGAEVG